MKKNLAYRAGVQNAFEKFALSPGLEHMLDLGGLGLIAAPVVHSAIMGEKDENPMLTRAKHLSDLAGLGLLSAPTISKLMHH